MTSTPDVSIVVTYLTLLPFRHSMTLMPSMTERQDDWLTTSQAAVLLGISNRTVQRYVGNGQLAAMRLPSGRVRIRRADVHALTQNAA